MSWETCRRFTSLMLARRGYTEHVLFDQDKSLLQFSSPSTKRQVVVWLFQNDKMNIDSIKEFIHLLETRKVRHGIIVYQLTITSSTKKVIEHLYNFDIELFEMKELLHDLTLFQYYCPHEKVSITKASELKKTFGSRVPILLRSDPVVRYFHFQRGDLIQIQRRNGTLAYRLVK